MKKKNDRSCERILSILSFLILVEGLVVLASSESTYSAAYAQTVSWPTYLGSNARTGYNGAETLINLQTASNLKMLWMRATQGAIDSQPVVTNDMVFWGGHDGFEHASSITDGTDIWATDLGHSANNCTNRQHGITSTATVTTVQINGISTLVDFVAGDSAVFYALDANSGNILWQTPLGIERNSYIYDSPAVYNGSVYIGLAALGQCPVSQGKMYQLDTSTGTIQNVYTDDIGNCTGGDIWGSPTIDETAGTLYFVTGDAFQSTCSNHGNQFDAIVELNANDLSYIVSWQIPRNQRTVDGDFGSTPTLFDATINGVLHHMVGVPNKNGIYYAFDRFKISAGPLWQDNLAIGGADPPSGGGSISSSSWDGTTLYAAAGNTVINGVKCSGSIRALDPATGQFNWQVCLHASVLAALMTVPGLIVTVTNNSMLFVLNSMNGNTLFKFHDGTGSKSHFWASPTILNGELYEGNTDGNLYAFGP